MARKIPFANDRELYETGVTSEELINEYLEHQGIIILGLQGDELNLAIDGILEIMRSNGLRNNARTKVSVRNYLCHRGAVRQARGNSQATSSPATPHDNDNYAQDELQDDEGSAIEPDAGTSSAERVNLPHINGFEY